MQYLFICALWAGYCALHSYLISIRFTKIVNGLLKDYSAFYRLFYVVISIVLLIPLMKYTDKHGGDILIEYKYPWTIVRGIFTYGSLLLFFKAFFFDYDSLSFFGIRQIMGFRKKPEDNQAGTIKKKGLLGLTRHPMYLALIIYLWAQTVNFTGLLINIILTIYVIIGTLLEEKKLVLEFGEAYKEYQREVPMLIPFVRRKQPN